MQFWYQAYELITATYSSIVQSTPIYTSPASYSIYNSLLSLSDVLTYGVLYSYSLFADCMSSNMLDSVVVSIKFILLIALLVFIRGGIPRYRFDHLTKMGWIKFLSLVLASILVEMLLIWIF